MFRDDARFGTLTRSPDNEWYETSATWAGSPVALRLFARDEGELDAALGVAHALWYDKEGWNGWIEEVAVEDLLGSRNETWHRRDEPALTPAEFRARMRLSSIDVWPGGDITWSYRCRDLFGHHTVEVVGNLRDGPTGAGIAG